MGLRAVEYPKTFEVNLQSQRLVLLAASGRFARLDGMESFYRCRQYASLSHDWNGHLNGPSGDYAIQAGYVPIRQRKPSVRANLPRTITKRLTSMVFGKDRFPRLEIPGDADAEDYVNALAQASKLATKMREARDLGGAEGTAVMSFGFMNGKPRIQVHNAKHLFPVEWADKYEFRLKSVLECYVYPRTIRDKEGNPKVKNFYHCRAWNQEEEILWDPIPEEIARTTEWVNFKRHRVTHGFGFCPVYWIQNLPDSTNPDCDGDSDYEGLCDNFIANDQLMSQAHRGTIANLDPTLIVKDLATNNTGQVEKGMGKAIWSPGGAEYLELSGTAAQTAMDLYRETKSAILDVAQVVLADPEEIAAKAQSAAAMRMFYQPMLNQCDTLREQYGDNGIVPLMTDMLEVARSIEGQTEGEIITTQDGRTVQMTPTVVLPDRVYREGEEELTAPRVAGVSSDIVLNWPEYFKATPQDIERKTNATTTAVGKKQVISQRTAVRYLAQDYGIVDVEDELSNLASEEEAAMDQAMEMQKGEAEIMASMPAPKAGGENEGGGGTSGGGDKGA